MGSAMFLSTEPMFTIARFGFALAANETLFTANASHTKNTGAIVTAHTGRHLFISNTFFTRNRTTFKTRFELVVREGHAFSTGGMRTRVTYANKSAVVTVVNDHGSSNEISRV